MSNKSFDSDISKLFKNMHTLSKKNDDIECIKIIKDFLNPFTKKKIGLKKSIYLFKNYIFDFEKYDSKKYENNISVYQKKISKRIKKINEYFKIND